MKDTLMNITANNSSIGPDAGVDANDRSDNSPLPGQAGPWLFGTVRAMEPTREMLLLQLPDRSPEQIIYWLPQTCFLADGAEVMPDALHDGQQIAVRYSSDAGQKFALEIDIITERTPATSAATAQRRSLWPMRGVGKTRR